MSGFFKPCAWKGDAIPLTRITSIQEAGENRHGVKTYAVRLGDNVQPVEMVESNIFEIYRRPVQLIPAQPDINLLHVNAAQDEAWREPVIAWALCMDGEIRPVCAGGVNDGVDDSAEPCYVEMPDKTVRAVGQYADPAFAATTDELIAILKARAA